MKKYITIIMILLSYFTYSQTELKGMIMIEENNEIIGIEGINVYWSNTQIGTSTNKKGWFTIPYKKEYTKLVISYLGFKTDTLNIISNKEFHHLLKEDSSLDEITITKRKKSSGINNSKIGNLIEMDSGELLKAACCNLSESFETNPSIDVNFSDAVTGTKQIKMLGLTSPYLLITQGNIPSIRGASQAFGLTYTPGTWINSIQITKGTGSVVNGYESISGQINTELKNPKEDDKLFVNLYGAKNGRLEANVHFTQDVSKNWHTGLYVHGNSRNTKNDENNDNFLDLPLGNQINLLNAWHYHNDETGWESTINFKLLKDEKQSGEIDFDKNQHLNTTTKYGATIETERFETSVKAGKVFKNATFKSIGFQSAFSTHNQNSLYGTRNYDIKHNSFYLNSIYQSIIGSTQNNFKTGISFTYDDYVENALNTDFNRIEKSIGTYFEYFYDSLDKLSFVAGLRADYNNIMDFFITPRLHLKYNATDKLTFRASAGSGRRTSTIFSENQKVFASSRNVFGLSTNNSLYGLDPEKAWNYGVSGLFKFKIAGKEGDISADFFRTDFQNQVVVDYENPQEVSFYNLDGQSFANSFQLSVNQEFLDYLDLRLAYKYFDVQTQYNSGLKAKPFQPKNRFFANLSYKIKSKEEGNKSYWMFDTTYNLIGKQRIPFTGTNPLQYQMLEKSPQYSLLSAQITKTFKNNMEFYIGGENLTNYKQKNPIIASDDPFGNYFDSGMIYAPIHGANYYAGFRMKFSSLKKEKLMEYKFNVAGVCEMCKERIEKACLNTKGVKLANWNVETKLLIVVVNKNETSINSVKENIAKVGHDTDTIKATQEVYDKLHHCCKYRDIEGH